MSFKITDTVSWVGKVDWEIRKFHGEEFTTQRGTSYNAYLIRGEKTVLIDTVWGPFSEEFVDNLQKEIDLREIDFVVANHGESDHSGALPALMSRIPDKPVYCTANGVKSLKGQYHQDWDFHPVKSGDKLSLGSRDLVFIEAPMLHWPDSMFCYLTGEGILFSNDAFGQHLAAEHRYNDQVDQAELYQEALKYYANILTPFSMLVEKKIREVLALNLPVEMICPSHGVIWRQDPAQIVNQYLKWANAWQENQITILYDTMWNGTRRMSESLADGIRLADPSATVKLYNVARSDKTEVMTEVFKSRAVLVGSSTINRGMLSSVAAILEEMKGLSFKNKKAAAFGTYGWSGEAVKQISQRLAEGGFTVLNDGLRLLWYPDRQGIEACMQFGKAVADQLK